TKGRWIPWVVASSLSTAMGIVRGSDRNRRNSTKSKPPDSPTTAEDIPHHRGLRARGSAWVDRLLPASVPVQCHATADVGERVAQPDQRTDSAIHSAAAGLRR